MFTPTQRHYPRAAAFIVSLILMLTGAVFLQATPSVAAVLSAPVSQCNNEFNAGGQGLACTITVVNNVDATGAPTALSTISVTRCVGAAGPIGAGAGTCATTSSTSSTPITQVTQCDGSVNGGGGVLICTVTVTTNVSGAITPTAATVYQCIGSVITGSGAPGSCTPVNTPGITSVVAATVGQCNGSGNGGTSVGFTCTTSVGSTTMAALPVHVDQCNGSTNGGGALTTCRANVATVALAAAPSATPAPVATVTPAPAPVAAVPAAPVRTNTPTAGGLPSTSTLPAPADNSGLGWLLLGLGSFILLKTRLRWKQRTRGGNSQS